MILLELKLIILDETDSGLDIDALKMVGSVVNEMRSQSRSFIVVTLPSHPRTHKAGCCTCLTRR